MTDGKVTHLTECAELRQKVDPGCVTLQEVAYWADESGQDFFSLLVPPRTDPAHVA